MHPLTTIRGDSAGTILIQGQGTIHRQKKLPLTARVSGHAWAEEERVLGRPVRHSPYSFTEHRQLKAPGKGGRGVLVGSRSHMSQQCALAARRANHTPWAQTQGKQPGKEAILPLPSAQEVPPHAALGQLPQRPTLQEKKRWF